MKHHCTRYDRRDSQGETEELIVQRDKVVVCASLVDGEKWSDQRYVRKILPIKLTVGLNSVYVRKRKIK